MANKETRSACCSGGILADDQVALGSGSFNFISIQEYIIVSFNETIFVYHF